MNQTTVQPNPSYKDNKTKVAEKSNLPHQLRRKKYITLKREGKKRCKLIINWYFTILKGVYIHSEDPSKLTNHSF